MGMMTPGISQPKLRRSWMSRRLGVVHGARITYNLSAEAIDGVWRVSVNRRFGM